MTVPAGYRECTCMLQRGRKSASARRIQREQWAIKAIRVNFIGAGTCWDNRSCCKSVMREADWPEGRKSRASGSRGKLSLLANLSSRIRTFKVWKRKRETSGVDCVIDRGSLDQV